MTLLKNKRPCGQINLGNSGLKKVKQVSLLQDFSESLCIHQLCEMPQGYQYAEFPTMFVQETLLFCRIFCWASGPWSSVWVTAQPLDRLDSLLFPQSALNFLASVSRISCKLRLQTPTSIIFICKSLTRPLRIFFLISPTMCLSCSWRYF